MASTKPNIILITFDSGRPDHLSFNGYKRNTTPFLDSIARAGVYFKNAFTVGPGSALSFAGMFTSTYPLDYGGFSHIARPRTLFPEILQKIGYTTVAVHSSAHLSGYFGYNQGWNIFRHLTHFRSKSGSISAGLRRETAKSRILRKSTAAHRWLENNAAFLSAPAKLLEKLLFAMRKIVKDLLSFTPAFFVAEDINAEIAKVTEGMTEKPIFLWTHYMDTHSPFGLFYRRSGKFWNKIKFHAADLLAFVFGDFPSINRFFVPLQKKMYDDSLAYLDKNIKKLFEILKQRGILNDDAVVIIHTDHGEEFLERGAVGHSQRLFDANIHVPLVFYPPRYFAPPRVIEQPVSLIDIAPTILEIAGASPPDVFKGKNIFRKEDREVVIQASESSGDLTDNKFTGIAIIFGGYKLILWKGYKFLFSLSDIAELNNLYDKRKDVVLNLEKRVAKYAPPKGQFQ